MPYLGIPVYLIVATSHVIVRPVLEEVGLLAPPMLERVDQRSALRNELCELGVL
jgi:hypothetical protein